MDSSGRLRSITEEEMQTMEDLDHEVLSTADIPPEKRRLFELVHKAGNRPERKRAAKKLKVNWHEYQIYIAVLTSERRKS